MYNVHICKCHYQFQQYSKMTTFYVICISTYAFGAQPAQFIFGNFFLQLFHLQLFNSLRWLSLADRTKQLHTRWSHEGTERTQPIQNVPI